MQQHGLYQHKLSTHYLPRCCYCQSKQSLGYCLVYNVFMHYYLNYLKYDSTMYVLSILENMKQY